MPADSHWYLVCYDVREAKRLRRVAKHLEGYGERMQYSIFRCWLGGVQMQRLKWELTELLEPEDDLMFIPYAPAASLGSRSLTRRASDLIGLTVPLRTRSYNRWLSERVTSR
jgi:CRISPR-associated protein Cas2